MTCTASRRAISSTWSSAIAGRSVLAGEPNTGPPGAPAGMSNSKLRRARLSSGFWLAIVHQSWPMATNGLRLAGNGEI
jgi:hypothetical protein